MLVCRNTAYGSLTRNLRKTFRIFLNGSFDYLFTREQVIDRTKAVLVQVIGVVVFEHRVPERNTNIRLVTTIKHTHLFEIVEYRNRHVAIPTVANGLKIEERSINARVRFLCFDKEPNV